MHEQLIATSDMQKAHEQWGSGLFSSEKDVWKAIENAIAIELQCEPNLKSHVRQYVKKMLFYHPSQHEKAGYCLMKLILAMIVCLSVHSSKETFDISKCRPLTERCKCCPT